MEKTGMTGVDPGKRSFQLHGVREDGAAAFRRKVSRERFLDEVTGHGRCTVAMEACGGAHHWGRELQARSFKVLLVPPVYVKPFVKRQKNDAADAEAVCEAASRPGMRFVAVKSAEQQADAMLFGTRDLLTRQRTQTADALRGHLAEHGAVVPQGIANIQWARRHGTGDPWLAGMLGRKPPMVVAVALANRMARTVRAMTMSKQPQMRPEERRSASAGGSRTDGPPLSVVFTGWLLIAAAVGSPNRSASLRPHARNAAIIRTKTKPLRQEQK